MRRHLFNLAAAVSLVILAAAVVGAVRAQYVSEELQYDMTVDHPDGSGTRYTYSVRSGGGRIEVERETTHNKEGRVGDPFGWRYGRDDVAHTHSGFGRFNWWSYGDTYFSEKYIDAQVDLSIGVALPWWSVAVAGSILPAWWLRRRMKARRRLRVGLCLTCGYDLRATPDRCPECGAVPQKTV